MPTYEYACETCKGTFEIFQSIKDEPLTVCPKEKCAKKRWGKGKVRRNIGAGAGLIFKGSGFYITDYRSEGYKQAAKKDSEASSSASSSGNGSGGGEKKSGGTGDSGGKSGSSGKGGSNGSSGSKKG